MVVGVVRLVLRIPENDSLKGKRRVLKHVIERTRNRFEISIHETGLLDAHEQAEIGIACVGNDRRVINSVLDRVVDFVDSLGCAILEDRQLELINL
jgi:uncharacterized protein